MTAQNMKRWRYLVFLLVGFVAVGCGMADDDLPLLNEEGPEWEMRRGELTDFCSVRVDGYGTLNVEDEYLAKVVTCENEGAPMEALKAQAIAARGYAKYINEVEGRPLSPTVRDQDYRCNKPVSERARQAVRETSGQVLTHNGKLILPFYVAGSRNVNSRTCMASGTAGTQKHVTYNQGRIGGRVKPSSLGWSRSPANRGAMSQNGANCLGNNNYSHERILRFFYGDDIRIAQLGGACVDTSGGSSSNPGGENNPIGEVESDNTCDVNSADPTIITRSQWGALRPKYNRPKHTPKQFTIHHTVTSNNDSNPKATIRQVQRDHMAREGGTWADIGYHYLVDQQGRIYAGNPSDRVGAHVAGQNNGKLGISFLGNYNSRQPTEEQLAAAGKLIRYLGKKYNIDVSGNVISAHRDHGSTECPGSNLYARLDRILNYARGEDASCDDSSGGGTSGDTPTYRYVRVRAMSDWPIGYNDTVPGFELDSVSVSTADGASRMANAVRSSENAVRPSAALGRPDNTTCDNRSSTVAGIRTSGEIVLSIDGGFSPGDTINVVQSNYGSMSDCAVSGTAQVAISADGATWTVVSEDVRGNAALRVSNTFVKFAEPAHGSTQEPTVRFSVNASANVSRVEYIADGSVTIGSSTAKPNFAIEYTFNYMRVHPVVANAYDANGNLIATDTIEIITEQGSGGSGSESASTLGQESSVCSPVGNGGGAARCSNGRGGYSTGSCWKFVKAAMIRAQVATRADIDRLASAVGMSGYSVQVSAAGFKRAADRASASTLASTVGLKKVNTPPTQAPRGAVIAWGAGCMGAHARYGHIEVSQGDGYACSDYCGRIRGNPSCASVYVPTN